MRSVLWTVVTLVVLGGIAGLVWHFRDRDGTFFSSGFALGLCQSNDEIDARTRSEVAAAASEFIQLFARAPFDARNQMSARGKAGTVARQPIEAAHAFYKLTKPIGPAVVRETYLLRAVSGSEHGEHVPCDLRDGRAVFVSRGGTPTSAVAIVSEALAGGSERRLSIWFEREYREWRVRAFTIGIAKIGGRDSQDLWDSARKQRDLGNSVLAAVLYGAASSTLQMGPYYQARMVQDFNADMASFIVPETVRGPLPQIWSFGSESFKVTQFQMTAVGNGDVALIVDHAPSSWTDQEEAEVINRRLIDGFVSANPAWREEFDGIVARAAKPDSNEQWATVFGSKDGYGVMDAPRGQTSDVAIP